MRPRHVRSAAFVLLVTAWAVTASAQAPRRVTIDVKPGDPNTTVERDRGGMVPVALLTTAQFDAASVDRATIRIGPSGTEAEPFRAMPEDVDRDGRADLLILVRLEQMELTCADKVIRLRAKTADGIDIEGSEAVRVEGCPGK